MKKPITSLIIFVVVFIAAYLMLCYWPGFRIKLYAPPMEYFVESIKHMVVFKALVSVVVGLLAAGHHLKIKSGNRLSQRNQQQLSQECSQELGTHQKNDQGFDIGVGTVAPQSLIGNNRGLRIDKKHENDIG